MKKIINIFYLLSLILIVASCSDDDENVVIPSQVTDLTASADYGAVILQWSLPSEGNIDYVNITYTIGDKKFSKNVSKFNLDTISGLVSTTIDGFGDTNEYTFQVASCNVAGGKSEPMTVTQAPFPPAYEEVIKTITIVPDFGGGIISWENETGKKMVISVTYPDPENPTARETVTFTSETSGKDYITNLPTDPITMEVTVSDLYDNSSAPVTFDITPLAESAISKDSWTVPGFDADSPYETIGYSSQQTNANILAVFDDDVSTFWHASWSAFGSTYPHWYIIDLGKEVTISRIGMVRRQGDGRGQKGQQFLTCTVAGATDLTDPTTWNWEDQGSYSFNSSSNDEQTYRLTNNPKARYVKVYFAEEYKGSNNFAMVAETNVYGQE
ncbi:MAG: DUF5126 domain-containing protein [Draconibacterium sp.]